MASHPHAVAIVGGAPLGHTNALFTAFAVNALNALLGSVGKPGGILFSPQPLRGTVWSGVPARFGNVGTIDLGLLHPLLEGGGDAVRILLLYEANPVFHLPPSLRVREALEKVPFIASFGRFLDETSVAGRPDPA
jgi:hypothetical protein